MAVHVNMKRELRTLKAMIEIYCHDHHRIRSGLCPECTTLLEYARSRLEKCPFRDDKPVCSKCPVHCYRPDMRGRIRSVMSYAGRRMLFRHPVLALVHLINGMRKGPKK
ncbi:MAG: nitrous oxide-stimulated promoter family protein [Deltaproteobacteria bacterium]|nr:nitrous oxide-stimulated promoter family protein [Deltaproteobacteria bacterium]